MPSGACVIRYDGKRGVVWKVKYRDADGRQVKETLGREADGWTERKAQRELGKQLGAVERGLRKPTRRTFDDLADEFDRVTLEAKPRKRSTLIDYRSTLKNHLRPWFGHDDLGQLAQSPEAIDEYVAHKLSGGLSPKTVRNHLALLGLMFKQARKWRWVSEDPTELVDRPTIDTAEAETLTPEEVARLVAAYRELAAGSEERYWFDVARRATTVALSTGMRRGEVLGLRWQDVELLDRRLHVRQSYVRGEMTTPKSRAGRRVLELGPQALAVLEEQFEATTFRAPEALVFGHEVLGTPLDPSKLTRFARKAFARAAIAKPFRP